MCPGARDKRFPASDTHLISLPFPRPGLNGIYVGFRQSETLVKLVSGSADEVSRSGKHLEMLWSDF